MEKRSELGLSWLKAICSICGKEYEYTVLYKPETCGDIPCFIKLNKIEEENNDRTRNSRKTG